MHRTSYCGVNCEKCKVYIATMANDDNLKMKVVEEWGALYKRNFTTEDIVCNGCKSNKVFTLCSLCDIKECNYNHGVTNCEDCKTFPCDRIKLFFDYHKTHDTSTVFE